MWLYIVLYMSYKIPPKILHTVPDYMCTNISMLYMIYIYLVIRGFIQRWRH